MSTHTGVFLLQLPELSHLLGHQALELLLPAKERLLTDARLAGDLGYGRPSLGLLQSKGNLLVARPGPPNLDEKILWENLWKDHATVWYKLTICRPWAWRYSGIARK
jgi:hypothetical protein